MYQFRNDSVCVYIIVKSMLHCHTTTTTTTTMQS